MKDVEAHGTDLITDINSIAASLAMVRDLNAGLAKQLTWEKFKTIEEKKKHASILANYVSMAATYERANARVPLAVQRDRLANQNRRDVELLAHCEKQVATLNDRLNKLPDTKVAQTHAEIIAFAEAYSKQRRLERQVHVMERMVVLEKEGIGWLNAKKRALTETYNARTGSNVTASTAALPLDEAVGGLYNPSEESCEQDSVTSAESSYCGIVVPRRSVPRHRPPGNIELQFSGRRGYPTSLRAATFPRRSVPRHRSPDKIELELPDQRGYPMFLRAAAYAYFDSDGDESPLAYDEAILEISRSTKERTPELFEPSKPPPCRRYTLASAELTYGNRNALSSSDSDLDSCELSVPLELQNMYAHVTSSRACTTCSQSSFTSSQVSSTSSPEGSPVVQGQERTRLQSESLSASISEQLVDDRAAADTRESVECVSSGNEYCGCEGSSVYDGDSERDSSGGSSECEFSCGEKDCVHVYGGFGGFEATPNRDLYDLGAMQAEVEAIFRGDHLRDGGEMIRNQPVIDFCVLPQDVAAFFRNPLPDDVDFLRRFEAHEKRLALQQSQSGSIVQGSNGETSVSVEFTADGTPLSNNQRNEIEMQLRDLTSCCVTGPVNGDEANDAFGNLSKECEKPPRTSSLERPDILNESYGALKRKACCGSRGEGSMKRLKCDTYGDVPELYDGDSNYRKDYVQKNKSHVDEQIEDIVETHPQRDSGGGDGPSQYHQGPSARNRVVARGTVNLVRQDGEPSSFRTVPEYPVYPPAQTESIAALVSRLNADFSHECAEMRELLAATENMINTYLSTRRPTTPQNSRSPRGSVLGEPTASEDDGDVDCDAVFGTSRSRELSELPPGPGEQANEEPLVEEGETSEDDADVDRSVLGPMTGKRKFSEPPTSQDEQVDEEPCLESLAEMPVTVKTEISGDLSKAQAQELCSLNSEDIIDAEVDIIDAVKYIFDVKEDIIDVEKDIIDAEEDIIDAVKYIIDVKEDIIDVEKDIIDAKEDIIDVKEDIIDVKEDIIDAEEDICDVKDDIIDVKEDIIDVKEDIIDAEEDIIDVKEDIIDVKEDIIDVKEDIIDVKEDIIDVEDDIIDAEEDIDVKEDIIDVEEDIIDVKDDIIDVEKDIIDVEEDIIDAEKDIIDVKEDIIDVEEDIIDAEEDIIDVKEDIIDVKEDIIDVKEDIIDAEGDIIDVKEDIIDVEEDIIDAEEDIINVKEDIIDVEEDIIGAEETQESSRQQSVVKDLANSDYDLVDIVHVNEALELSRQQSAKEGETGGDVARSIMDEINERLDSSIRYGSAGDEDVCMQSSNAVVQSGAGELPELETVQVDDDHILTMRTTESREDETVEQSRFQIGSGNTGQAHEQGQLSGLQNVRGDGICNADGVGDCSVTFSENRNPADVEAGALITDGQAEEANELSGPNAVDERGEFSASDCFELLDGDYWTVTDKLRSPSGTSWTLVKKVVVNDVDLVTTPSRGGASRRRVRGCQAYLRCDVATGSNDVADKTRQSGSRIEANNRKTVAKRTSDSLRPNERRSSDPTCDRHPNVQQVERCLSDATFDRRPNERRSSDATCDRRPNESWSDATCDRRPNVLPVRRRSSDATCDRHPNETTSDRHAGDRTSDGLFNNQRKTQKRSELYNVTFSRNSKTPSMFKIV